jgi:hypothetical protein
MHKDFADWYRAAGIEPTADELSLRWKGVEKYEPERNEIAVLAPFFYGLSQPSETFLGSLRAPFKEVDAAFKMTNNDNELRV